MAGEPKGAGSFADVLVDAGLADKEDVARKRKIAERARKRQAGLKKVPYKKKAKRR